MAILKLQGGAFEILGRYGYPALQPLLSAPFRIAVQESYNGSISTGLCDFD